MNATTRFGSFLLAAGGFCLLAIFNCGGYRYGVGDQAFHIPAVLQHLDPALFPRDRLLLHAQDRFMLFDDGMAAIAKISGLSLPTLFLTAFLAGLVLLFAGAVWVGRIWYHSWWTVTALVLVMTLRHRISQTGVNTLENYLNPRMLAFAIGVCTLAAFMRGRRLLALGLLVGAAAIQPTTALWFGLWIFVALAMSERDLRRPLLTGTALAVAAAVWMLWSGPLQGRLEQMDSEWVGLLGGKDYIFPADWGISFWVFNLAYPAVVVAIYRYRRAQGQTLPREEGLVAGALALVAVFLLSWPFAAMRVALAVQLQVSRVFWMLDFLAAVYVVWLLVEAGGRHRSPGTIRGGAVAAIALLAVMRGGYVMWVEHAGAPVVQLGLPRDDWEDVMAWAARTPSDTHLLADPGHAWKYGTSARVAAERDVYLEEVKDVSLALYSREVAQRVVRRIRDLGDFNRLTPQQAEALASRYDLDYLISEQPMPLPLAYHNQRFSVYALGHAATGVR